MLRKVLPRMRLGLLRDARVVKRSLVPGKDAGLVLVLGDPGAGLDSVAVGFEDLASVALGFLARTRVCDTKQRELHASPLTQEIKDAL